jgi:acetoacetyl-CoA synthetase
MGDFLDTVERATGRSFADYHAAWQWSVEEPGEFWRAVWGYFDVWADTPPSEGLADASMPGAVWFPDATLNYAEHLFRGRDPDAVAIVHRLGVWIRGRAGRGVVNRRRRATTLNRCRR